MMTIHKIGVTVGDEHGALQAAQYPLDVADSPQAFARAGEDTDAGTGPVTANTMWLGSPGAVAKLGVKHGAEVVAEQLALALQGRHALSGRQLRQPGTRSVPLLDDHGHPVLDDAGEPRTVTEQRVNSVDLTMSVPKSVSAVWVVSGPQLRARIEQAAMAAANAALGYMTQTKPVVQGVREPARGFVASAALHVLARKAREQTVPSPQLHVHGLLVGVEGPDGSLRTPDTAALFKRGAPLEGGAVFRAVLAEELRALGFDLEWGTGRHGRFFEIRGVPQGLIDRWSARGREVERDIARREVAKGEKLRGAERAAVAVKTRAPKDRTLSAVQIARTWAAQAQEFAFGRERAEALCAGVPRPRAALEELRDQARAAILEHIWEQGPTVPLQTARAIAFEVAPMGLSLRQANDLLADMQRSGEVIALEDGLVTTRKIRDLELQVIGVAIRAASTPAQPLSERACSQAIEAANRALGAGKSLDPDQREAIDTLTQGNGWAALTGRAGTGKGPVLHAVAEAHRQDGWSVIACAVDGATAQRLGHQIGSHALTIDQVISRVEHDSLRVGDRTAILIEEASKVGLRHWAQIAELVEEHGVRVLAVGHAGQLGAIELPGMFEQMLRALAIPTAELSTIRRHRNPSDEREDHPWMAEVQVLIDEGKAHKAMKILRDSNAITMRDTRAEAIEALVDGWDRRRRAYEDPREAILVVHGPNEDIDVVNELAQERRIAAGDLPGDGVQAVDRSYSIYAGDVVMLREGPYGFGALGLGGSAPPRVENGTIGIVERVDRKRDRVAVWLQEPGVKPRVVEIDQRKLRARRQAGETQVPALRLAYAFHPFPLQGATVKDVAVLGGHPSEVKEAAYVALTRASHYLHIYVDRASLGTEGTDEQRFRRYARRWMRSQERVASISKRESDERIAVELPGREATPPLRGRARITEGRREAVSVPDPLGAYRMVLGEARAERLAARAALLGQELAHRDEAWLWQRRDELGTPLADLNAGGAHETLRVQRDKEVVQERLDAALREAAELERRAGELTGLRNRAARSDLREEAQVRRQLAGWDRAELNVLATAEQRLRKQGRHLDDWLAEHGERAARWAAVEREIAIRVKLEVAREPDAGRTARDGSEPALVEQPAGGHTVES
jgi:conjugative relaxase-like TrwC/TraI family protein